ncbi:unnamed protein product, partial [Brassica rapa]
ISRSIRVERDGIRGDQEGCGDLQRASRRLREAEKLLRSENVFAEMKRERVTPNLLTYSTLIDVYSKGGLYKEAMEIFKEFKGAGLRPDVVLYSALIDALCKNGLVGSAVSLIDEMTKEGISPNVVTYIYIIDDFGRSATVECLAESGDGGGGSSSLLPSSSLSKLAETEDNQVMQIFGKLAIESSNRERRIVRRSVQLICRCIGAARGAQAV